ASRLYSAGCLITIKNSNSISTCSIPHPSSLIPHPSSLIPHLLSFIGHHIARTSNPALSSNRNVMSDEDLAILIVDDRPDKLLALSVALAEVCPSIVTADSGRAALKLLL